MLSEAARVLAHRLERFGTLGADDKQVLRALVHHSHIHRPKGDVFREGDRRRDLHVVVSGLFCRYRLLADGSRQILAILLPGDLCDSSFWAEHPYDFSVGALACGSTATFSRTALQDLYRRPALARAFSLARHVDDAISREWLVNMGRRGMEQRLVRLLSELTWRLEALGLVLGNTITLAMNQTDLADALGVTHISVCRTLKQLEAEGLLVPERGRILVQDVAALRAAAGTYPAYLGAQMDVAQVTGLTEATRRHALAVALVN
ncbi:Crp/Fnr family transcriptional regulator [Antarcticirhabdus aurantiaca]|uniref:Crp/Fnr family transcriptional regulator n=1 Tax=Antarcticirhabdus aurantiaca TaxID=2606717 RepID=A0ACD4NLY3_9HYPH|nr:Crp/Fnr family transcriptional regulator [Antarcticirhabdus aurantiaca]WAJ27882.1 Crp/Fnr family transcriptional regulator [Jeongeuplla avenae]